MGAICNRVGRQRDEMQRQANHEVERRIRQAHATPADMLKQRRAERPAYCARQAGDERDNRHCGTVVDIAQARQCSKRRFVQSNAHGQAQYDPARQVRRIVGAQREGQ
jgi:hypothetical protein